MLLSLAAAVNEVAKLRRRVLSLEREVELLSKAVDDAREFAFRDELTGLPNRRLLLDHFNQALVRAERQGTGLAVLVLDIDGFKGVNDTHGHAEGDRLLQQVAARLVGCIRSSDTACRWGGDEFLVLLSELQDADSVIVAAQKIRTHLGSRYFVGNAEVDVAISIGAASYPADGEECMALIRRADCAMYREKGGVRGTSRAAQRPRPTLRGAERAAERSTMQASEGDRGVRAV